MAGRKKGSLDMTSGTIWKLLVSFTIPLLLGNVFQQLYSTVDSYVVGNFVSSQALAAVGSTGHITGALIGFYSGLAGGAGIVVSQYFGAKDRDMVSKTVHTAIIMTLMMCAVITVLGVALTPGMLRMMKTPADVWDDALAYLTITFYGTTALLIYNIGAGILQAVGNTRTPLIALIISAITNVVLDLVLVIYFRMGVRGVAWATVIAQAVSGIYVMAVLMTTDGPHRVSLRKMKFHGKIFARVFAIGIPSALQMSVTSFSNMFVQAYINAFGSACMAGYTIYAKIDTFAMLPMSCLSVACSTFAGQNIGAGQNDRVMKGLKVSQNLSLLCTGAVMIPLLLFREQLTSFFNADPEVIRYGGIWILTISPFYLVGCITNPMTSVLRGAGETTAPMITMLGSFVVFRQIYLFIFTRITDSFLVMAFAYPAGWVVNFLATLFVFYKTKWKERCLIQPKTPPQNEELQEA